MIFFQLDFFVFFALFFALYLGLRRRLGAQNLLILAGSYIFYGWWDPRFLILIAASTAVDYLAGLMIAGERADRREMAKPVALLGAVLAAILALGAQDWMLIAGLTGAGTALYLGLVWFARNFGVRARAKLFVTASVTVNLGILGLFKYFDFFAGEFAVLAQSLGWDPDPVTLNLILPVGISFYTFQTMSYTLDIYRGQLKPTRHFVQFAAFVSFFPQLVAGPIERARNLLPQFEAAREVTWERLQSGAMLFLWGFYKKVAIADNLAPVSDRIFADPMGQAPAELLAGVLAFTFQIYCDFSGYSDMARGIARMLGFELMLNFRMPYFARTPSEFWQRWHISLSSWLRDYLYIPLGGNRGGGLLTYRNLVLTMLLGGLWHGAAWTFIAWGAFHGGILVAYRALGIDRHLAAMQEGVTGAVAQVMAAAVMFLLALISWVFFRAASMEDALYILSAMWAPGWSESYATVAFFIAPLVIAELVTRLSGRINPWDRIPRFAVYNQVLFLVCASVFLAAGAGQKFIYFDF